MAKQLPTNRFTFEVSVIAAPHTEATRKIVFGGGYNSDYPIETHAVELIGTVLQDARTNCLVAEMKHLAKCNCEIERMTPEQRSYHEYLQNKTNIAEFVQNSLKFVRVEPPT